MPPKVLNITADHFETKYGAQMRAEYSQYTTARQLKNALANRPRYPILVSDGVLKQWFLKYNSTVGAGAAAPEAVVSITSRADLESKYGHMLGTLADEYPTEFKLVHLFIDAAVYL